MENKKRITFEYRELGWRYYTSEWTEEDWLNYLQEAKNHIERAKQDAERYGNDSWYAWHLAFSVGMYEAIKDITFDQLCDILADANYVDSFTYFNPNSKTICEGYWLDEVKDAMREDCWNNDADCGDNLDTDFEITGIEG